MHTHILIQGLRHCDSRKKPILLKSSCVYGKEAISEMRELSNSGAVGRVGSEWNRKLGGTRKFCSKTFWENYWGNLKVFSSVKSLDLQIFRSAKSFTINPRPDSEILILPCMWFWTNCLPSLSLNFLICKMEIITPVSGVVVLCDHIS